MLGGQLGIVGHHTDLHVAQNLFRSLPSTLGLDLEEVERLGVVLQLLPADGTAKRRGFHKCRALLHQR